MELGLALLERLEGDVALSPYGLARALDVIRRGATGETRAALDKVIDEVPEVDGMLGAQAAWLGEGYTPGPALTLDTGPLDADRVNAWSNEKTRGMVPRIVERFNGDEILAITDAEYLRAQWQHPFEETRPAPFEGVGEVPMMLVEGRFEHADGAVRLPYKEHDLRFVAMLGDWGEQHWRRGQGTVELPRFTAESSLDLVEPLVALGLGPAFETGRDLENLVTGPGDKGLSRVLQRARVDVDEEGTTAAATTAVTMRAVSMPLDPFHIVFDRPFTWAVEHAPTGTLLFVGRVLNPTERSD
jgi:serine protease inhibitor